MSETVGNRTVQVTFEDAANWQDRHPSTAHFKPLFAWEHLPQHLQNVSIRFALLANQLLGMLDDGPELTVALRKLLEAKDAAVRQAVLDRHKMREKAGE